jgi:hypothetical protein
MESLEDFVPKEDGWARVSFLVEIAGNLPPSIFEINTVAEEYRKNNPKKKIIENREYVIGNILRGITPDYKFVNPDSTCFSFDCRLDEIVRLEDGCIIYDTKFRQISQVGKYKYVIEGVIYKPEPPQIHIRLYRCNDKSELFEIVCNLSLLPAPMMQWFNPREDAVRKLRSYGMSDSNIYALHALVMEIKKEKRKSEMLVHLGTTTPVFNAKKVYLDAIHKQKYYVMVDLEVEEMTKDKKPKRKTVIRKVKSYRTLKNISFGDENFTWAAESAIIKLIWKEDYMEQPADSRPIIDHIRYLKYQESIPTIRW